jgi:hypothetical protein
VGAGRAGVSPGHRERRPLELWYVEGPPRGGDGVIEPELGTQLKALGYVE